MTSDYPFFPGFVAGSDTSEAAAESIEHDASRLRRYVHSTIASRGERGATCDEIEASTGLRHQTASARVRELVMRGLVFDTGQRRATRSGRMARVYRITTPRK